MVLLLLWLSRYMVPLNQARSYQGFSGARVRVRPDVCVSLYVKSLVVGF